jgi:hypothetical protein
MKGIIGLSALANKDRGEKCLEEAHEFSKLSAPTGSRQRRKQFWKGAQKETKKGDAVAWRSLDAHQWRSFSARYQIRTIQGRRGIEAIFWAEVMTPEFNAVGDQVS